MTLRECYEMICGDYEGVTGRLVSESLVRKFALKFLNDPSFGQLQAAIGERRRRGGVPRIPHFEGNLPEPRLYCFMCASSALTEKLRGNNTLDDESKSLFARVHEEYNRTIQAIEKSRSAVGNDGGPEVTGYKFTLGIEYGKDCVPARVAGGT